MTLIEEALALYDPKQAQARLLSPNEGKAIREFLEAEAGGRTGGNMYCVRVHNGKQVHRHNHPEDVILFYPQPEGVPVIVEHDGVETAHYPNPGDTFLVPKGVFHRVPAHKGTTPRISIALKLED